MKTLPTFAFLAALVAFVVFPLSFEIGGSLLFAAGFVAITFHDYRRTAWPLMLPVTAPVVMNTSRKEKFGLAA